MIIREAADEDLALILDSFTRSYWPSPYAQGHTFLFVRAMFERVLASPAWQTDVLCDPEIPDEILGFVVHRSPAVIAWLQVKHLYRQRGHARALLEHVDAPRGREIRCPFLLPHIAQLAAQHGYMLRFRPYLLLELEGLRG
jgi:hypothetical protein